MQQRRGGTADADCRWGSGMPSVPLWAIPAGSATACLTAARHGYGEVADVRCLRRARPSAADGACRRRGRHDSGKTPAGKKAGTTAAAPPANSCRALPCRGALFTAARHAAAAARGGTGSSCSRFSVCFL
ncbi:hypothetical protein MTO96_002448 [Rhipicephalus appendiculatus]